jgi:alanine dehydrogenase
MMFLLSDEIIRQELSMPLVIDLVEQAFAADARGQATTFPAIVENVGLASAHFGIKSGYLRLGTPIHHSHQNVESGSGGEVQEVLGLKAGGYWAANTERYGLPSHRATILLINPDNGEAMALMSANEITRMRTAAAGAVAARHLAKTDAATVTVIGTGEQAYAQIEALRLIRPIDTLYVWGRRTEAIKKYVAEWCDRGIQTRAAASIPEALATSDIVVTTTPSTKPLVLDAWVRSGTHINAIGSDGVGKRELDPLLFKRSKFVVDSVRQSVTIGELQNVTRDDAEAKSFIHAELGEICAGMKPARESEREITIFDSSGVSFQDLVVANFLVERAKQKKLGQVV